MDKIKNFLKKVTNEVKDTVIRFPGVIVFLIICYVFNPMKTGIVIGSGAYMEDLFFLSGYGIMISFILEIVLENLKQKGNRLRLICYGIIVAMLSIMLVTGFFSRNSNMGILRYYFGIVALGSLLCVAFAHKDRGSFEKNCVMLFVNGIKAIFFSSLFISTIQLLLFGIKNIFEIKMMYNIYAKVSWIGIIFLNGLIFLAGVPRVGEDIKCPKFFEDIMKFIVAPGTLCGVILLYLYLLKIKFVLKDVLVPAMLYYIVPIMVFVAGVSVFVNLVENKSMEVIKKILAIMLIPLVFIAVYLTGCFYVKDGIMFTSYISVVACIVAATFIVVVLIKKSRYQYVGFLVLSVLLVVASVGPLSAGKLIEKSQQKRITKVLEKYNMIKDNKLVDGSGIFEKNDLEEINRREECLKSWDLNMPDYYDGSESSWDYLHKQEDEQDISDILDKVAEELKVEKDNEQ